MTTTLVEDLGVTPYRWSLAEYRQIAEAGMFATKRVELIRGEIYEMSPMSWPHVVAKTKTAEALRDLFAGAAWVNEQGPMPVASSQPEPDVAVYPGQMTDYADHPFHPWLVVEIADSSLNYDLTTKLELYAEAGVPEYWVVNLVKRVVHVFRDPVELSPGGYSYATNSIVPENGFVTSLQAANTTIPVVDLLP
jgi:Uma2 family endonuclease